MKRLRFFETTSERNAAMATVPFRTLTYTDEDGGKLLFTAEMGADEIWYTTKDGNLVTLNDQASFGEATINSHTYSNGKGVIKFDRPLTSIGSYSFSECTSLTSVTIPDSVTNIDYFTFSNCTSLTSVTIPDSVTSIGNYAFGSCTSLVSIVCMPTTPPTLSNTNSLYDTNNCSIYVPSTSVESYKTAAKWSSFADRIQAINDISQS